MFKNIKSKINFEKIRNISSILGSLSLFGILVLIIGTIITTKPYESTINDVITVLGVATENVSATSVSFNVELYADSFDKEQAINKLNYILNDLITFLKSNSLTEKNIQIDNLIINQGRVDNLWSARKKVSIVLFSHLESINDLHEMIMKNFNRDSHISNPKYQFTNKNDGLLKEALNNAKKRAEVLAASSNKKLGDLISIEEGDHLFTEASNECKNSTQDNAINNTKKICQIVTVKYKTIKGNLK